MCGRVTQFERFAEIPRRLGLRVPAVAPRYNLAPTQPIVALRRTDGALRCDLLRWGIPSVRPGRPAEPGSIHVNARSETAQELPTFRDAVRVRRCLVPVDGFFEWRNDGKVAVPFYFNQAEGAPLALAGLWSSQPGSEGAVELTACLLTTAPNRDMSPIHARMPVIVAEPDWQTWLTESALSAEAWSRLVRPAADGLLRLRRVGAEVNRAAPDHPGLLVPAAPESLQGDFLGELG